MARQISLTKWCAKVIAAERRRDADDSGRDDRAPHLQLYRSGLAVADPNQDGRGIG